MKRLLLFTFLTISVIYTFGQCDAISCNGATNDSEKFSSAIGDSTVSTGRASFASGIHSSATGYSSFAAGHWSVAAATSTLVLGDFLHATGGRAFALGSGVDNINPLINNINYSLMIGFNSINPTFMVKGPEYGTDKTGKVAIGNMTNPQAKLHIYSDDNEAATVFLQPSNWNSDYKACLWMGNKNNGITADIDKGLLFDSEHDFIFNTGNVGIGTNETSAKLDVDGSARIRDLAGDGERVVVADSAGNLNTIFLDSQCVSCVNSTVTGDNASVIGLNNNANAINSVVIGNNSNTDGWHSIAIGTYANTMANAMNSISIGDFVTAVAGQNIIIGMGYDETYRLSNNIQQSLMIGFNSDKPTLFVSRSIGYNKTGRVSIGNMTDPKAKLHIYSDDDESATLFLQPSNWTTEFNAEIWLGDTNHRIAADIDKGLLFKTANNYVFENGNMGIGTEEPSAKLEIKSGDIYINDIEKGLIMKSPDGKCWRGTLDNSGSLNFTLLESCPDSPSAIPENNKSGQNNELKVYPNPSHDYLNVEVENTGHRSLTVSLTSEGGVVVKTSVMTSNKTRFYTNDLKAGVYFVKVTEGNFSQSKKVVIQ